MLQLFRSNQLYILPLLFILLAALRAIGFIHQPELPIEHAGVLSKIVYAWVGTEGILLQILALILVFAQAFLVNAICSEYQLTQENTYYPALFYILLSSFAPSVGGRKIAPYSIPSMRMS